MKTNRLKTLQILHLSMCVGLTLFLTMMLLAGQYNVLSLDPLMFDPLSITAVLLALLGILTGPVISKNTLKINSGDDIFSRFTKYQTSKIILYAFIEAPAFFAIIIFFKTSSTVAFLVAVILIGYLFLKRPGRQQVIKELQLDYNEQDQLGI